MTPLTPRLSQSEIVPGNLWSVMWPFFLTRRARKKPVHWAGSLVHAMYEFPNREIVTVIPTEDIRSFWQMGLPIIPGSGNPFVETALELIENHARPYSETSLARFYESFRPESAVDLLGLDGASCSDDLRRLPAKQAVLPWWPSHGVSEPGNFGIAQENASAREFREHGGGKSIQGLGLSLFGPVSDDKGRMELERLKRLVSSIRSRGYVRNDNPDGDITGHIMQSDDGRSRVFIFGGLHRSAVMAALGADAITVRLHFSFIPRLVRQSDSVDWPYVRNGLFSEHVARTIFERIFRGREITV